MRNEVNSMRILSAFAATALLFSTAAHSAPQEALYCWMQDTESADSSMQPNGGRPEIENATAAFKPEGAFLEFENSDYHAHAQVIIPTATYAMKLIDKKTGETAQTTVVFGQSLPPLFSVTLGNQGKSLSFIESMKGMSLYCRKQGLNNKKSRWKKLIEHLKWGK